MALLLLYHTFAFLTLFSYGLYHLILSAASFFKSSTHTPRPYHPLPLPSHRPHLLRHLPLSLSLLSLLISISHHLIISSLSSLHTAASLSLFPLLLLVSPSLPPDLSFLLSSLAFALLSLSPSPSPSPSPDLQSLAHSISSSISSASAALALILSVFPRLFVFELALAASVSLQGLWSLQTGLSLYVDRFVPEGCHRLLDVTEATTRCDLEASWVRAGAVLDLALAVHAVFVATLAVGVFVGVGKACAGGGGAAYEPLPTAVSGGGGTVEHLQMKAFAGKASAQA